MPLLGEPFNCSGRNDARFGTCEITPKSPTAFWTELKKTTTKWDPVGEDGSDVLIFGT